MCPFSAKVAEMKANTTLSILIRKYLNCTDPMKQSTIFHNGCAGIQDQSRNWRNT